MTHMHEIQRVAQRMEDIACQAGLPRFDRVQYRSHEDEVVFLWEHEPKLAIIIEMNGSADAMAQAVERAMATDGDPVLN